MNSAKMPMSTSYKVIFVLSILMIFVVIISGALSGSKSVGLGVWVWGYTAWLMFKRKNTELVSFYKLLLWFYVIAAGVAVAVLSLSDSEMSRYVGFSPTEVILLFVLVLSLTYGLYKYFVNLVSNPSTSDTFYVVDSAIWDQVTEEVKMGKRVDSLWTRAFSEADGDSNKANARYIKLRFDQIKLESANFPSASNIHSPSKKTPEVKLTFFDFWNNFNTVGKLALVCIVLLVVYGILGGDMDPYFQSKSSSKDNVILSQASNKTSSSQPKYFTVTDGSFLRWHNDNECFVDLKFNRNSVDLNSFLLSKRGSKTNFKELVQEDRMIALLYYDDDVSDSDVAKTVNRQNFLKIKALCEGGSIESSLLNVENYLLPKLAAGDAYVNLSCIDSDGVTSYSFFVKDDFVLNNKLDDVTFKVHSRTRNSFIFYADSKSKGANLEINITGTIDTISSAGSMYVKFKDRKSKDYTYNFTCKEVG